jgi:4-hydroxybenzoate polyprenyltransferase
LLATIIRFLVYSNIFIATCALALTYETFLLLHLPSSLNWYLLLIFLSTIFIYDLHYYINLKETNTDSRSQWCREHKKLVLSLIISSFILIVGAVVYHFNSIFGMGKNFLYHNLVWFIIIPVLALAYSYPVIWWRKKSLRQIGWLKMALLSFVWSFTTVALPVLMLPDKGDLFTRTVFVPIAFLQRFVFIAALSLLFNIRDYKEDKEAGIKTLAVLMGEAASLRFGKWVMTILNSLFTFLLLWTFELQDTTDYLAGFIPIILLFLLHQFFSSKKNAAFVIRNDGLMLVQALLLIFVLKTYH